MSLYKGNTKLDSLLEPYVSGLTTTDSLFSKWPAVKNKYASGDSIRSEYGTHIKTSNELTPFYKRINKTHKCLLQGYGMSTKSLVKFVGNNGYYDTHYSWIYRPKTIVIEWRNNRLYAENTELLVSRGGISYYPKVITVVIQAPGGGGGATPGYNWDNAAGGGGSGAALSMVLLTDPDIIGTNTVATIVLGSQSEARKDYNEYIAAQGSSSFLAAKNGQNCSVTVSNVTVQVEAGKGGIQPLLGGKGGEGGTYITQSSITSLVNTGLCIYAKSFSGAAGGTGEKLNGSNDVSGGNTSSDLFVKPVSNNINGVYLGNKTGGQRTSGTNVTVDLVVGGGGAASYYANGQNGFANGTSSNSNSNIGTGGGGGCSFKYLFPPEPTQECFGGQGGPSCLEIFY